jgi:hypothetical protein
MENLGKAAQTAKMLRHSANNTAVGLFGTIADIVYPAARENPSGSFLLIGNNVADSLVYHT